MAESELERLARVEQDRSTANGPAQKAAQAQNALNRDKHAKRTAETTALTRRGAIDVEDIGGTTADPGLHPAAAEATDVAELSQKIEEIRRKRIGWGSGLQQKLALPKRRGYHRHWFNDFGNRIEDAKASGWAHIKGSDGQPIQRVVGTARSGQPLTAFAMELPEVIWLEDLEAKNKAAEDQLEQVRTQPFQVAPGMSKKTDANKFYDPHEGQGGSGPVDIRKG